MQTETSYIHNFKLQIEIIIYFNNIRISKVTFFYSRSIKKKIEHPIYHELPDMKIVKPPTTIS